MKRQLEKQDFVSLFKKEAELHIQELDKGLSSLESAPQDRATLEEVRRRAHTLKGSAKMMGFAEVSDTAHAMENLLESVRMDPSELDEGLFDKLFQCLDSIKVLLQVDGEDEATDKVSCAHTNHRASLEGDSHPEAPGAPIHHQKTRSTGGDASVTYESSKSRRTASTTKGAILVDTDKLDSLAGAVGEMVLDQIKSENQMTEMSRLADLTGEQVKLWSRIEEKISRILDSTGANGGAAPATGTWSAGLQIEEINAYSNLSMSLLENMTNLLREYRRLTTHRKLIIERLQDDTRSVRLIPISVIFDTFPRAVRDLGKEYNREINLVISGGEVELDKSIIEAIKDPLMHLMRNAVDHGIEEPEERLRRGKPRTGNISLSAHHQGSKVVIEISDDGAGIDLEKVKRVALQKGYVKESQLETMGEEAAAQLIFLPGLSTSSIITDVSGRGVGMDVVMENISRKLKGTVNIHTEAAKGTKISLAVPITLAVMRGLLVRIGQEMFAIPTESIKRNDRLPRDRIRSVEGKQAIVENGTIIPLVQLSEALAVDGASQESKGDRIQVIIVDHATTQIGFCIDSFVGEQEMVIKSLGSYLKRVPCIAGATVLGSGEVVPILHMSDLVNSARNIVSAPAASLLSQHAHAYVGEREPQALEGTEAPAILIVDDSLTTRELERNILEASGFDVHIAVDGLDGLNKVSERKFDLIISDVQMPRMDGFQMVETLKQNEQYRDIPVIMVTALSRDEEKRRGMEVGASAYIAKSSFDQSNLLGTILTLIG